MGRKKYTAIAIPILLLIADALHGENLPVLEPEVGPLFDFSPERIDRFNAPESFAACDDVWQQMELEGRGSGEETEREKAILELCDETKGSIWSTVGAGCSWYCGGLPQRITASRALPNTANNSYAAENAHDFSYETAWVEGVEGYGIGEFLTYEFPAVSPRITRIIVVNGYVKSEKIWRANSRVKQLKVYKDDQPLALLNLKDIRADQSFSFDPIGHGDRADHEKLQTMPAWTLRIEIVDVYKGAKYDDTVLSELYFDGIDVH